MRTVDLEKIVAELTGPGMPFEVSRQTINGTALKTFINEPQTLWQLLARGSRYEDKIFLVDGERRLSFVETKKTVAKLAIALRDEFGIEHGDRVAIAMRNCHEFALAFLALTSLGAIAVPMNAWGESEELAYVLNDSGARLVIADDERLRRMQATLGERGLDVIGVRSNAPIEGMTDFASLLERNSGNQAFSDGATADDPACIMYTSGSSGKPKGVVSTHRQILSAVITFDCLLSAMRKLQGANAPNNQPASLLILPLFHVSGCHSVFLLGLAIGAKLVVMRKWDAGEALRLIERENITTFNGVPTMSLELMSHPDRNNYDLSSLTMVNAGGAARPAKHVAALAETFTGALPTAGYGLTETNALGCFIGGPDYMEQPTSVGRPTQPLVELEIRDPEGKPLPAGDVGEVWIKSAAVANGYWKNPEATAEAFVDGWLRTGDGGALNDAGFLILADRLKDIVIRGGENVSCVEVERAIVQHEDVLEAAVFGLPDERLGEIVAAAVRTGEGTRTSGVDIQDFLSGKLAAYKIPQHIAVDRDSFPKLGSGKPDKRALRHRLLSKLGLGA